MKRLLSEEDEHDNPEVTPLNLNNKSTDDLLKQKEKLINFSLANSSHLNASRESNFKSIVIC